MYFDDPKGSALLKQFVREYKAKHNEYRRTSATRVLQLRVYKAAVEKAAGAPSAGPRRRRSSRRSRGSKI